MTPGGLALSFGWALGAYLGDAGEVGGTIVV